MYFFYLCYQYFFELNDRRQNCTSNWSEWITPVSVYRCIVGCFFYSWGKVSVPLCYSFKGPSTTATTAMVSSLSVAKVLCNTLLFISGFSPEELPTIASEYLFKNSNLRLFYIHTVVIFMNKDGNYVSLFVCLVCVAPDPLSPLISAQKLKTRCSSCCLKIHLTAFGSIAVSHFNHLTMVIQKMWYFNENFLNLERI